MFYLALAFFLWLRGFAANSYAPYGMGIRHALMTATFTHGFMPDTITSIVPGSWSIADEMMFYANFPLLIVAMNRGSVCDCSPGDRHRNVYSGNGSSRGDHDDPKNDRPDPAGIDGDLHGSLVFAAAAVLPVWDARFQVCL